MSSSSGTCRTLMAGNSPDIAALTPVRRQLGTTTDDAAIFLEDTVDRATAQCIDISPSALALLTPQRLPTSQQGMVDVTEYDASHLGSLADRHGGSGERSFSKDNSLHNSGSMGRLSGLRSALHDVTNRHSTGGCAARAGSASPAPTPTSTRSSMKAPRHSSHLSSLAHSTPRRCTPVDRSPAAAAAAAEPMVSLMELEAVQRERNRLEKMYEHQRALYEEMAEKQSETQEKLQEKIVEVVALSTRNEESKRFIRQLKREFSESRTRVMDMQNKALEEAKAERTTKARYETILHEKERKYERLMERHETKMAGMESLVKDLTCLRGEGDRIHVSQLDSLLKAAYAKSTALFSDLLRQGKQIDLLYDAKCDLEGQVDQLRRERRETEAQMRDERRCSLAESERLIEQIDEQQQSILNLRQMLIRTMDNRDNLFAYSRGPRGSQSEWHTSPNSGEEGSESTHSGSAFSSSSPPSPITPLEDDKVEDREEEEEGEEEREESRGMSRSSDRPQKAATAVGPAVRTVQTRPVISASALSRQAVAPIRRIPPPDAYLPSSSLAAACAAASAATSNSPRREVPPLPLPLTAKLVNAAPASISSSTKSVSYRLVRGSPTEQEQQDADSGAEGGDESKVSAGSTAGVASRRRLDFSSALAAVAEKRRHDRAVREENFYDPNTNTSNNGDALVEAQRVREADKENGNPALQRRTIVRSCAVGSIATARRGGAVVDEEEEEEEPKLFQRAPLCPRD